MALITGSPLGTYTSQEELYLEGAPYVFYQRYEATELYSPDADGYYYNLTGTATYPVYELGCYTDVSFTEDVTINAVRCDKVGDKDSIQHRNYVELSLTIQSMFPFTSLAPLLKGSTVTVNSSQGTEKFGMGQIDNTKKYHVWLPKVYDETAGDYVGIMLHKAKPVGNFNIGMASGETWKISGLSFRAYADDTKPAGQEFATIIRADHSVI